MSSPIALNQSQMLESLQQHKEIAKGAIQPNRMDNLGGNVQGPSFGTLMTRKVQGVNADQIHAAQMRTDVDLGRSDDLVGAMVASQKASLSFSALIQVRNKLVSAFDDVMKMPL
ncbi:flagellar hook-basal body complex protein FliE [Ferrimonas pelagia]|uniref:Flagellar hook-basal body complex protein FliE n=1 Tax=Ferrimonas pelagia TaxID=1177826 RepID=A0ABP9EYD4_9GAMM